MGKIYKIYLGLLRKYKKPEGLSMKLSLHLHPSLSLGFWKKWCKRSKTKKDKEEIVLGAILTQRTNWKNVELALKNLRGAGVLSIEKIHQVGEENRGLLENLIRPSGFYRQKAKRLFELCKFIVKNYGTLEKFFSQDLETCRKQLLQLSGVGPETADSILLYAGQKPIFVIDEYTRRFVKKHNLGKKFLTRITMKGGKEIYLFDYDCLQELFQKNLPKNTKIYQDFHAMIVLDGKPRF